MDQFREEVVIRRSKGIENLSYISANIVMVITGLYGLISVNLLLSIISTRGFSADMIFSILLTVLMIGASVVCFLFRDRIKTEYEYTFTNGIMDFAKVFNNKKRKALGTMNIRNVEACGYVDSGSFRRYLSMPQIKRTNWFLNRDAKLFYFYYVKNSEKNLLIFEPSEEMRGLIMTNVGQGKYQQN